MDSVEQSIEKLRQAVDRANRLGKLVIIFSLPPVEIVTDWLYWLGYVKEGRN